MPIIDSDQHLYESRTLWREHIDPRMRDEALRIEDDASGTPRLRWRGRDDRLGRSAVPRQPGRGRRVAPTRARRVCRRSSATTSSCRATTGSRARASRSSPTWASTRRCSSRTTACCGSARCDASLPALLANMAAWNRWCVTVAQEGRGRLHPVAHLSLRDPDWLEAQLAALSRGRRAPGDDRARAGRRPAALASGTRSHLGGVLRAWHDAGVPCRRSAARVRRRLVHRRRRRVRPGARRHLHSRAGRPLRAAT